MQVVRTSSPAISDADPSVPQLTDLTGFTHFVASRQGLFVVGGSKVALFAPGRWFGLTVRDAMLYAFNHRDKPDTDSATGRVLRFAIGTAAPAETLIDGLGNGCHQMDFIDDALVIVDTYDQRLLRWRPASPVERIHPIAPVTRASGQPGYVHMNSVTARAGTIWLMLHNGGQQPSEILTLDRQFEAGRRMPLTGHACHNIVVLEDGELLYCASREGQLRSDRGRCIDVVPGLMSRGLSVGREDIAVGSSMFGLRSVRHGLPGTVSLFDRDYRLISRVMVPGAPTEIRRIDGQDLSLANYGG